MRSVRFRQLLLPRNREIDASTSTAIKCQQIYTTSQSADSANSIDSIATPRIGVSSVVRMPYSPPNTNLKAISHSTPDVLVTPAPIATQNPILLLEGDHYRFSASGIARSLYQLVSESSTGRDVGGASSHRGSTTPSLAIEEIYDLKRSRKAFVIREKTKEGGLNGVNVDTNQERDIHFDDSSQQTPLLLQEIANGCVENGAGTGSRTWDSSIAMSAYFASHPELMVGNVIELGSGVGLGGILSFLFRSQSSSTVPFHSMTLTDSKLQVINCCNENVKSFLKSYPSISSIHVAKLDWYDVLKRTGGSSEHAQKYDTVIACDCAYDYTDIVALVSTLKGLLKKKKTSKAHIFGPSNRAGLGELLSQLRQEQSFFVQVEYIEMVRYRLEAPHKDDNLRSLDALRAIMSSSTDKNNSTVHSKFDSEFLHVTCSLRLDSDATFHKEASLPDID
jgi:predicted nicotinamide N-methyase